MRKLISASQLIAEQDKQDEAVGEVSWAAIDGGKGTMSSGDNVMQLVESVQLHEHTHFYTDGAWNMHQLLIGLIGIAGKSDVYLSSFAMSETAVRALLGLQDVGLIKSLHCVIDNRVETRSAGSLQLLKSISNRIVLRACHAKVTIIEGEHLDLVILGSANYTENKRMEVGVITKSESVSRFHKEWICKILAENG
jgi:hypothetical protein